MSQFFTYAVLTATVASALGLAAPFLLAALGETVGQRSGVINLGVDGIMLLSAFTTYFTALKTGNLLFAVLVGMGTGAVMGIVTAFISVTLKAEQGISGIGVYLFGLGFSDLMFIKLVGTPLPINSLNPINIPLLDRIPAVGGMFFKQTILVYVAFLLVPVVTFVLNRTTFGMKVRASGENPAADWPARPSSSTTASSRRISPRARVSSPSHLSTSVRGVRPASWVGRCSTG